MRGDLPRCAGCHRTGKTCLSAVAGGRLSRSASRFNASALTSRHCPISTKPWLAEVNGRSQIRMRSASPDFATALPFLHTSGPRIATPQELVIESAGQKSTATCTQFARSNGGAVVGEGAQPLAATIAAAASDRGHARRCQVHHAIDTPPVDLGCRSLASIISDYGRVRRLHAAFVARLLRPTQPEIRFPGRAC